MIVPPSEAPKLTEEQARPLAVGGASVALSSGAGCGKTTVLTARFLARPRGAGTPAPGRDRRARRSPRRRRASSGSGSARPAATSSARATTRRTGGPSSAGWRRRPSAPSTSSARAVLRRFALEAGIDPDFTVLEESLALSVRSEALARSLREWLSVGDPDLIELATEFGLESVRQSLLDLIAHRAVGELGGVARPVRPRNWSASGRTSGRSEGRSPGCTRWPGRRVPASPCSRRTSPRTR